MHQHKNVTLEDIILLCSISIAILTLGFFARMIGYFPVVLVLNIILAYILIKKIISLFYPTYGSTHKQSHFTKLKSIPNRIIQIIPILSIISFVIIINFTQNKLQIALLHWSFYVTALLLGIATILYIILEFK